MTYCHDSTKLVNIYLDVINSVGRSITGLYSCDNQGEPEQAPPNATVISN